MAKYHSAYRPRGKRTKGKRVLNIVLLLFLVVLAVVVYLGYQAVFSDNVWVKDGGTAYVYINNGDNFDDVKDKLYQHGHILNRKTFEYWATYKKYPENIKSGRYKIWDGMSNNDLVSLLRSGEQEAVRVTFNNIRLKTDLAENIAAQLAFEAPDLLALLDNDSLSEANGFNKENVLCMFVPNTYFLYWNSTPQAFYKRMKREYKAFWTEKRLAKAASLKLSPIEVSILASIVDKETQKNDEKARVAGVYLNRLKSGWRLQADPTLVYAMGDFTIRRVLNVYKDIESPYNTYKHLGLPPGPICVPSVASIDAVLNAEDHDYYFFCAKPDLSGYHAFAKTDRQHRQNAKAYREFLNKQKVYK